MNDKTFVGFDGKRYPAQNPPDGSYLLRHDGRFWHILFPIADDPDWRRAYHGKLLPQDPDIDRWIKYRPYPPRCS